MTQTTHFGSLPRTQAVVDFIFAREHGKPFDQAAFDACMTAAVDIVSDGETSKISYATAPGDTVSVPENLPHSAVPSMPGDAAMYRIVGTNG